MAGDWIKLEHATPDKPEVVRMANLLGIDQDAVTGKLLRIWVWADQNTVDGNAISVTDAFLDRLVFQNGFAKALRRVGWLDGKNGKLSVPQFGRHNGETAKKRAETNRRVAKSRQKKAKSCQKNKGGEISETLDLQDKHAPSNTNVTEEVLQKALPEKRREEKSIKKEAKASSPLPDELKPLWKNTFKISRERSSQKQVAAAWRSIPKTSRPAIQVLESALEAWKLSDKWLSGCAEGLHRWINNRQWENIPEAGSGQPSNKNSINPKTNEKGKSQYS